MGKWSVKADLLSKTVYELDFCKKRSWIFFLLFLGFEPTISHSPREQFWNGLMCHSVEKNNFTATNLSQLFREINGFIVILCFKWFDKEIWLAMNFSFYHTGCVKESISPKLRESNPLLIVTISLKQAKFFEFTEFLSILHSC